MAHVTGHLLSEIETLRASIDALAVSPRGDAPGCAEHLRALADLQTELDRLELCKSVRDAMESAAAAAAAQKRQADVIRREKAKVRKTERIAKAVAEKAAAAKEEAKRRARVRQQKCREGKVARLGIVEYRRQQALAKEEWRKNVKAKTTPVE